MREWGEIPIPPQYADLTKDEDEKNASHKLHQFQKTVEIYHTNLKICFIRIFIDLFLSPYFKSKYVSIMKDLDLQQPRQL